MVKETKDKPIRITVDLSPRFYERLERVEKLVGSTSKAEVVREALRLYEYLVTQASRGAEFQVVEAGSDRPKALVLFTDVDAA